MHACGTYTYTHITILCYYFWFAEEESEYYGNETDSYVSFRYLIFVESTATVGSSYTFEGTTTIGSLAPFITNPALVITDAAATKVSCLLDLMMVCITGYF